MGEKSPFFTYKNKPLVRCGNTLYYGSMKEPYVVMMQILGTKEENGRKMAQDVMVQLMRTGRDVKPQDMVVKKSIKQGLYAAMDIAEVWLSRALSESK